MALTELENHLLAALHSMESTLTARMDSMEKRIIALSRDQEDLRVEVQHAHGLVNDLQALWRRLGDMSRD